MRGVLASLSCTQRKRVNGDTGVSTGVHPPTPKSTSFLKTMWKICVVRGQGTTCSTKGGPLVLFSLEVLWRVVFERELGEQPKDPFNDGVYYLIYWRGVGVDR